MYQVVALGELLIDFTPYGVSDTGNILYEANPGGAPCNVMAQLNKLGNSTAFIGKVGNDCFGRELMSLLKNLSIGTQGLLLSDTELTTLAFVSLDEKGDRNFSFARKQSADVMLRWDEVNRSLIEGCDVFHCGTLSMTDEPCRSATLQALAYAKQAGKLISVDPNLREPLWKDLEQAKAAMWEVMRFADIAKISDYELEFLLGPGNLEQKAEELYRRIDSSMLFVTCGRDGAYLKSRDGWYFNRCYNEVKTVDTTGAGDSFLGAALHKILALKGEAVAQAQAKDILQFASAAASLVTTRKGAIQSMASPEEIADFLQQAEG